MTGTLLRLNNFSALLVLVLLSILFEGHALPLSLRPFSLGIAMSTSNPGAVAAAPKRTLYDEPVSNSGARCRIVLYKKEIPESEVAIVSPSKLGGLKSDQFLRINPQGKMPSMVCTETGLNLAESDTICRYILTKYPQGPSFQPDNPKSNLISRMHDMYLTTIQGCMYKAASGSFGPFGARKDAIAEFLKQLKVIETLIDPSPTEQEGMYLCGDEVSLADAALFPTIVFANHMLPKFDIERPLPPKISRWFSDVKDNDPVFQMVYDEIMSGLNSWDERNRWKDILGAGWRDTEPATIFDKLIKGEIPADIVREDNKIFAFKDINPAAPAHVLVIPKDRAALTCLSKATDEHREILGSGGGNRSRQVAGLWGRRSYRHQRWTRWRTRGDAPARARDRWPIDAVAAGLRRRGYRRFETVK
jgi:glutathione S-transferase